MSVFRCYSQKMPGFDVEAQGLCKALQEQLGVPVITLSAGSKGVFDEKFYGSMELLGKDCSLNFEQYHDFYRDNYTVRSADNIKPYN